MIPTEKDTAYRSVAKHIFVAHRMHEGGRQVIILADTLDEAHEKARIALGVDSVFVKRIMPTENPQVYDI